LKIKAWPPLVSLWRKSTRKPEETGIKAVIAPKTAARWEQ
jgi:hypothetical protein